jgi:nitroreductase
MIRKLLKGVFPVTMFILCAFTWAQAQELKVIKLVEPTKKGGLSVMEALSKRASVRSWADKNLSSQDLSDLLWAANGINRPESKMRTAPSAGNAQEVDIYVFMKDGVFIYDAANQSLNPVASGDHRSEIGMSMGGGPPPGAQAESPAAAPSGGKTGTPPGGQAVGTPSGGGDGSSAPIILVHVADFSKYGFGSDEQHSQWASIDVGIVSQNIAIACAARGMVTRPMVNINKDVLKTLLKLKDTQQIILRQPVGYPPDTK